ncbi:MAG: endolytic transglycosylase MltG [Candidatus Levybacteria bacterium]|nr:endolytic transglycosylase MltG [Candidatus Levybacteria bacterium]
MKKVILLLIIFLAVLGLLFYFLSLLLPTGKSDKVEIVILKTQRGDSTALVLEEKGFIRSFAAFNVAYIILGSPKIEEGGYYFSKNMSTWKIIDELADGPDLKEVVITEGLRKEQIGERLGKVLGWTDEELDKWNNVYTEMKPEYTEGVYFPDTYLIPVKESGPLVAARMINNFNEKFAPYFEQAAAKNIKWTTVLKIASLIEREAAGREDMSLISGIIWNRLENNQRLDIDATIQYAIGKRSGNWWSRVSGSDIRNTDSVYNTYKYSGLPPTPIANPSLSAIKAALNPRQTECFYYLHSSGQIYCSVTYEEHLENIKKYLN